MREVNEIKDLYKKYKQAGETVEFSREASALDYIIVRAAKMNQRFIEVPYLSELAIAALTELGYQLNEYEYGVYRITWADSDLVNSLK